MKQTAGSSKLLRVDIPAVPWARTSLSTRFLPRRPHDTSPCRPAARVMLSAQQLRKNPKTDLSSGKVEARCARGLASGTRKPGCCPLAASTLRQRPVISFAPLRRGLYILILLLSQIIPINVDHNRKQNHSNNCDIARTMRKIRAKIRTMIIFTIMITIRTMQIY